MIQPCRNLRNLLLLILLGFAAGSAAGESYSYGARVAWLDAGELALHIDRNGAGYEFSGSFQTSREMNAYYTWNGVFAGVGRWQDGVPESDAYLSRSVNKDQDLKIVVMSREDVRVLEQADGEFESSAKPSGNDLISALFLAPACYRGGFVHDGEDQYQIALEAQRLRLMDAGPDYYRGGVTDCDYVITDHRQRKRRVIVSLAEVGAAVVAVQVQAKIPLFPDPIFRLKVHPPGEAQVASIPPPRIRRD